MKKIPTASSDYLVSTLCYVSRAPPNGRIWHKAIFKVSPGAPVGSKNALGPVGIPLKRGNLKHQAINIVPPRRVRAWGTVP